MLCPAQVLGNIAQSVHVCVAMAPIFFTVGCALRAHDEWSPVKRRYRVVENIVHPAIHMALATRFPRCNGSAHFRPPLPPRPFDRPYDPIARRRCKRNEFPARAFERKAMFVIPARRVRPQRRDAHSIFDFSRLRNPLLWRAVRFRSQPSLYVPAVHRKVFRYTPQLHRFANLIAVRIAIRPSPANPRQPRPAPHHAKVRLAITVHPARARGPFLHASRRFMRFSCDSNQGLDTFGSRCRCTRCGKGLAPGFAAK
jgi:hypothetical protein